MADQPTVCVIGAGISGLTAVKALVDSAIPVQGFESSDDVGGNWYFRNPNGRSSAYRSLHIDTSKPAISFRDFPLPDDLPDFPHHTQLHQYLRDYADAFGLRDHIRFGTTIEHARRLEPAGGWEIMLDDGSKERYDVLLVGNGHHWDPSLPDFPGTFDGPQIHSHHYIDPHDPVDLVGKRVLVVGIGNSGVDIASELSRKGEAERCFISTRSGAWVMPKYVFGRPLDQVIHTVPWLSQKLQRRMARVLPRLVSGRMEDFGLPTPDHQFLEAHPTVSSELLLRLGSGDLTAKPDVAELLGDRVRFTDGSVEEIDAIVYATGYRISFPFFDEDFISAPGNRLPLYKRMFKPGIDDLAFIGLAQAIPTLFPFAEAQSQFLARWIRGEWALPSPEEMERRIAEDDAKHVAHFNDRPRHTMQHDFFVYTYDLERHVLPEGRARAARGQAGPPLAGRAARAQEAAHA